MFKDIEIREALIEKLNKENKSHYYRLINELVVCDGDARVDIAVANGKLCGYEIKSDKDTLYRLPRQVEAYNRTFDKITIVVGEKYESKVINEIPEWWGIEVAYENKFKHVSFRKVRASKMNKEVDAIAILQLLWKDEILELLRKKNIKGLSSKNRRKLRDIAAQNISLKELKDYTREILKSREGWRADQPQE